MTPHLALADVSGPVRVIDGDTFDVGETRVRLHGIDAPELDQTCTANSGGDWPCGEFVRDVLRDSYQGQIATCQEVDTDRYGRMVAKCFINGRDVGEDIVLSGYAEAYRQFSWDYDLAEKTAQIAGVGLWSSDMQTPSAFRADQRAANAQPVPDSCFIKGNISGSGRIYHMPHNRDYERTRINEAQGERWFCSEADAQAAGWRAARN